MVKKWEIYDIRDDFIKHIDQSKKRLALIISNDIVNKLLPIYTIIPMSIIEKNDRLYPTEIKIFKEESGLENDVALLVQQIKTISTTKIYKVGEIISDNIKHHVNEAISDYFEI